MAEVQLQPDELDRLEDALEDLELDELLDDPSPAVRARLADYRALLIASREALPMVDVPPGVLAGVLAEARRADDELVELSAADEPRAEESWWSRVRKSFLIPTLAVVGTAALILVIVTPTMSDAPNAEDIGVVARVETPTPAQTAGEQAESPQMIPAPPGEASPEPAAADGLEDAEEEAEDAPVYEIATARRSADKGADKHATGEAAAVGGNRNAEKDANAAEPAATEAERKDEAPGSWEAIERGDKARTGGDCFRANNEYQRALDDGNDSVRARALVGLGLCAAEDGNASKADAYYKEARALDPEVGGYIDTQSNDDTRKSKRPAPRKKDSAKRKASMPALESQSQSLPGDARNANPYKD